MDLKERILAYMRNEAYKPLAEEDLGEAMGLTDEELVDFAAVLEELEKEGIQCLPGSLEEAIKAAENDPFIKSTLGEHVYNNYIEGKKREWDEYKMQISQWEVNRYMINH